jgi:hypothetical protein
MRKVFVLSNSRSGTAYLSHFVAANALCTARHEPFFDLGNPTLSGPTIYHNSLGHDGFVERQLAKKKRWIERYAKDAYFEANHGLLKGGDRLLAQVFPEAWYVHAVREPIKTVKSMVNREHFIHRLHIPGRYYRGDDGQRHFRWALSGHEPIFRDVQLHSLSLFQRYVLEWIEIENRTMRLLTTYNAWDRCFFLDVPTDLTDAEKLLTMIDFLSLKRGTGPLRTTLRTNSTPGRSTVITPEDRHEFLEVVEALPLQYLEIFQHPPYTTLPWCPLLHSLS